jgi:hypothetical protein
MQIEVTAAHRPLCGVGWPFRPAPLGNPPPRAKMQRMNWEALSAVSTALTALVIFITAIYAAKQVNAMNSQSHALTAQLEHLRRATLLEGTLAVFEQLFSPDLLDSYRFVVKEFATRMNDDVYRRDAIDGLSDPETHKEVQMLRHMERIGTLIKNDLLDAEVLLDFADEMFISSWSQLEPLALEQRRVKNNMSTLWENYEYLARKAQERRARLA